jgi:hypothetical protein
MNVKFDDRGRITFSGLKTAEHTRALVRSDGNKWLVEFEVSTDDGKTWKTSESLEFVESPDFLVNVRDGVPLKIGGFPCPPLAPMKCDPSRKGNS